MITKSENDVIKESVKMLRGRLEKIQESEAVDTDDYHQLFLYFIGDQFEGIPPDKMIICDQMRDQKIDFYYVGENRFAAYQCKLPDIELLEQKGKIKTFGTELINEAEDILTFMTDDYGSATGNKESQEARNRYRSKRQLSKEADDTYKLEVILAFYGKLSKPAQERLEELKNRWITENEQFEIKTIDIDKINSELNLSFLKPNRPKNIKLIFRPGTEVHQREWGYALVTAKQFCELVDKYKMALFDFNVRYYLEHSSVNKEIIKTLKTTKGQKNFHLLNNGITFFCTGWSFPSNESWFKIYNPQIINGCQTVISIYRAYTLMSEESLRRNFEDNCYVPVRIIQTQDRDLLGQVVTASNNQNKMSPRNLRSNSHVQIVLQNKFGLLKYRWFYEKKDGEFNSLREYSPRGFDPRDYAYSKNRPRIISNEIVAKTWLSFIGLSKDASEKINAFDFEGDDGRYEWLFERRPKEEHWRAITLGSQVEFMEQNFEPFSPTPEQYLLAYLIFEFVKAYLPTPQANRKDCEVKLRKTGGINKDSSPEKVNQALMADETYVLNQILYNMKEVIVELYSWVLIRTYGPLNEETAKKILQLPGISEMYSTPDFKSFIKNMHESSSAEKITNILFTCFEFIKQAVSRWKNNYGSQYLASQRRIRFLHLPRTVEQMKKFLNETNEGTKDWPYEWKPPQVRFLESLPKI